MEFIKTIITDALIACGIDTQQFSIEHSELAFGDYSTNVALLVANTVGENPKTLAEKIAHIIREKGYKEIESVSVAGPGFINFVFSREEYGKIIHEILDTKHSYGTNFSLEGRKTIIEYTDPNPFKEFHIGHLMSNTIGEALSRIIEANGAEVKRACYSGDTGMHVAQAVAYKISTNTDWKQVKDIGKSYANGATLIKTDEAFKQYVIEVNKKIHDGEDAEIMEVYKLGREVTLNYFESIYKKLGTTFDFYFFESQTGNFGKEVVESNTPAVFEKSDGAIIYRGELHDPSLHTRVFINKEGLPTYEAKELGLAKIKYEAYPYETSIVITGNEINDYFRVLLSAMSKVYPDLSERTVHISHGMLRLPTGKMSSRTGDVIVAESLITQAEDKAREIAHEKRSDDELLFQKVAIGAIKYSILRQAPGKDIIFDFNTSITFEGDSGPYLQYTRARINSINLKAEALNIKPAFATDKNSTKVERLLIRYSDVVLRAGREYAPHYIVTYLLELAGEFNHFYATEQIIQEGDIHSSHKLAITLAVGQVLENGLTILGIPIPTQM